MVTILEERRAEIQAMEESAETAMAEIMAESYARTVAVAQTVDPSSDVASSPPENLQAKQEDTLEASRQRWAEENIPGQSLDELVYELEQVIPKPKTKSKKRSKASKGEKLPKAKKQPNKTEGSEPAKQAIAINA